MLYNNLKLTWKNGSRLNTDVIHFDNWEMKEFISKYLNSFDWNDFGFYYLEDIKAEIKENIGDEDYEPPIDIELFKQLDACSLVLSGGEIFPEEVRWNDFREYLSYLERLGLDVHQEIEFNSYEIQGFDNRATIQLFDESYGVYNFIGDIIYDLKLDGEELERMEKVQFKDYRTDEEQLKDTFDLLHDFGYKVTQL